MNSKEDRKPWLNQRNGVIDSWILVVKKATEKLDITLLLQPY